MTSEDYFTKVLEDDLKAIIKPQYVDMIPKAIKGPNKTVGHNIEARSEMGNMDHIMEVLGKNEVGFQTPEVTDFVQNLGKSKTERSVSCLEASSNALPSLFLVFSEPMCKHFPRMAQYHFADYLQAICSTSRRPISTSSND